MARAGLPCMACGGPASINIFKSNGNEYPEGVPYGNLFCFDCYERFDHKDLPHDLDDFHDLVPDDLPEPDEPDEPGEDSSGNAYNIADQSDFEDVSSETSFCKFSLSSWQDADLHEVASQASSFRLVNGPDSLSSWQDTDLHEVASQASSFRLVKGPDYDWDTASIASLSSHGSVEAAPEATAAQAAMVKVSKREVEDALEDFHVQEAMHLSKADAAARDKADAAAAAKAEAAFKARQHFQQEQQLQWARDMKKHLPPVGEERKKTHFCKYNDPDLQWQYKGQNIYTDWSADGQGMNDFSCPKHGTVCIAGCAGCNKVRNKKEIHKELVQEQAELLFAHQAIREVMWKDGAMFCSQHVHDFQEDCCVCLQIIAACDSSSAAAVPSDGTA